MTRAEAKALKPGDEVRYLDSVGVVIAPPGPKYAVFVCVRWPETWSIFRPGDTACGMFAGPPPVRTVPPGAAARIVRVMMPRLPAAFQVSVFSGRRGGGKPVFRGTLAECRAVASGFAAVGYTLTEEGT